jgi:hypothetical protein
VTPAEYRELRRRRAEGRPPVVARQCAGCGVAATLAGGPYCGPCALVAMILGKPGVRLAEDVE